MRNFLLSLLLFVLWFSLGIYIYMCQIKQYCNIIYPVHKKEQVNSNAVVDSISTKDNIDTINSPPSTNGTYQEGEEVKIFIEETPLTDIVIYTGFGSNTFEPDDSLNIYITKLITYLESHPLKAISIIGHTDDVGDPETNEWIGMERAKSVSEYIVSQGVPEDKIKVLSKGETSPIVENNSLENRRKNRRIEIKIN
ncbi:OmpA family protein [Leptobacterium sp. I13]|uniref:OmpA family protein n=1 Tax=Leptobacterium meishanense TaxID=3128904 RepID=UPI0030EF7689